jgi:LmbE family N-acetylglucosaminyl deacetylase
VHENGRRLLAVLAHPDDESFGPGGTLALYAKRGAEVHLICATAGEEGDVPPEMLHAFEDVPTLRKAELSCAASCLGLAGVHFLGYRDSGMAGSPHNHDPGTLAAAPLDEVAKKVTHHIRALKPQVVITFDPIGGYRHPDHIAIHKATVEAFRAAGDASRYPSDLEPFQPEKLYFHTFSRRFLAVLVRLMPLLGQDPHRWGRNHDIDLTRLASDHFPIHARIDYSEVEHLKRRASACHASQAGPPTAGLLRYVFRLADGQETFMRAYPPATPGLSEADLFSGIQPDSRGAPTTTTSQHPPHNPA